MSLRQRLAWLAVGVVVSVVAFGLSGYAQGPIQAPTVLSGPDLGFRLEGQFQNQPYGTLMVRVKGEWVEVRLGKPGAVPLTSR